MLDFLDIMALNIVIILALSTTFISYYYQLNIKIVKGIQLRASNIRKLRACCSLPPPGFACGFWRAEIYKSST